MSPFEIHSESCTIVLDATLGPSLLKQKFQTQSQSKINWVLNRDKKVEFLPIEFRNDKEYVLKFLSRFPFYFKDVSEELQQDPDVILKTYGEWNSCKI